MVRTEKEGLFNCLQQKGTNDLALQATSWQLEKEDTEVCQAPSKALSMTGEVQPG